ncbi:MAG: hypothetical protein IJW44_00555 [Clostridia bacterium]|nr:hypothetical protein [Clostridia bacterium]
MKKLISLACILSLLLTALTPLGIRAINTEKTMDLYLIAGQSNAAGCTKVTSTTAAYAWAPELAQGYTHVHYAGNSRSNGSGTRDRIIPWQKTTLGLGITNSTYMGPEAGMARALSAYYNAETGREAGIIKYAFGGSSLLNLTTGSTHQDGNWVSPSYKATLTSGVVENVTGKMYDNFLAQVEQSIRQLEAYGGYTKVKICGLYWMQGCANRNDPEEYAKAFAYFASDVRRDLSAIMKAFTGSETDDGGASEMPIVVGTISQTQNLTSTTTEATNRAFIAMQNNLGATIPNCYTVDNSGYRISQYNGKNPSSPIVEGSDRWHWNQADMLQIGDNVGDELLLRATGFQKARQYAPELVVDTDTWEAALATDQPLFEIDTAGELLSLFRYLNQHADSELTLGKTFRLTADIDLNPGVDWEAYNADPIGYEGVRPVNLWVSAQFRGTLEGQGHSIRGLWHENFVRNATSSTVETAEGTRTVTYASMNSLGLIHLPKGCAEVRDLVLEGGRFSDSGATSGCSVGAIFGCVSNNGLFVIENCYVGRDFTVDARMAQVNNVSYGGIIGSNWSTDGDQELIVRNTVFAGTLVTPELGNQATVGAFMGKAQRCTSGGTTYPFTLTMVDCMFAGRLIGGMAEQIAALPLTRGTGGSDCASASCARNYTSQPASAGNDRYLAKHGTLGVLPVTVADMLSSYYWQEDGQNTVRLVREINSVWWVKVGFMIEIGSAGSEEPVTKSHLTTTVYEGVMADGAVVSINDLIDLAGIGLDVVTLPETFVRGKDYTVTVTPIWEDQDGSYRYGCVRSATICLPNP